MQPAFRLLLLALLCQAALGDPGLIQLANTTLDPEQADPQLTAVGESLCQATPNGTRLYLVQPKRNFSSAQLAALSQQGLDLHCPVPPNAYILEGTPEAMALLKERYAILYACEVRPEWKRSEELEEALGAAAVTAAGETAASAPLKLRIQATGPERLPELAAFLTAQGAVVERVQTDCVPWIEARGELALVERFCRRSDVSWVEERFPIKPMNTVSSTVVQVREVREDCGLDGAGEMAMVADTGLDTGVVATLREDFQNRQVLGAVADNAEGRTGWEDWLGHGTHVCGTVCGSGAHDAQAVGMAPRADLYMLCVETNEFIVMPTARDLDLGRLAGARSVNCSWGEDSKGKYSIDSQFVDTYAHAHPEFLLLFSAGNSNDPYGHHDAPSLNCEATSKNAITIGASQRPEDSDPITQDRGMADFSSRGPTKDGRQKPELCAPGTSVLSCDCQLVNPRGGATNYVLYSGTSMSTPVVTGASILARQGLKRDYGFADPSSALLKALLVNGARKLNGSTSDPKDHINYVSPSIPNVATGYGELALRQSLYPENGLAIIEDTIAAGQELSFDFEPEKFDQPVNVTLCWNDPPGNPKVRTQLINDLDLVCQTARQTYYANNLSQPWDRVNNLEKVRLAPAPPSYPFTVTVKAVNLMQGPQDFVLVVSNAGKPIPEPAALAGLALALLTLAASRRRH